MYYPISGSYMCLPHTAAGSFLSETGGVSGMPVPFPNFQPPSAEITSFRNMPRRAAGAHFPRRELAVATPRANYGYPVPWGSTRPIFHHVLFSSLGDFDYGYAEWSSCDDLFHFPFLAGARVRLWGVE